MSELLICNEPIAALPYYIEGISWNVYSMEELCYYLETNTYLLEKEFMSEELCIWIEKEIKNLKLAERLRNLISMKGRLSEFVQIILEDCGYCTGESIKEIIRIVHEMEGKSDFECSKIRADRLMENDKYLSSIYEYKSLLDSKEAEVQNKELLGCIWHNLATAYARLFLFGEAGHCYEKAYHLNRNTESLYECLLAYHCAQNEEGFQTIVEKYQIQENVLQGIQRELSRAVKGKSIENFEKKIASLSTMRENGQKQEYQKALSTIIFEWKEEYRRICRI